MASMSREVGKEKAIIDENKTKKKEKRESERHSEGERENNSRF